LDVLSEGLGSANGLQCLTVLSPKKEVQGEAQIPRGTLRVFGGAPDILLKRPVRLLQISQRSLAEHVVVLHPVKNPGSAFQDLEEVNRFFITFQGDEDVDQVVPCQVVVGVEIERLFPSLDR
jgi:hypothetical protein